MTRPLTWKHEDQSFVDYEVGAGLWIGIPDQVSPLSWQVNFVTDESCFDQNKGSVRRTIDEFEWLVHKLQATYHEPVADQMPALDEEEETMTAVSEFFSLP